MSRLYVGLPPTKLLMRLKERLLAQQIFPVETTFPIQALWSCASIKRTGVARIYFEVQVYSLVVFFLCCVEEIRKKEATTSRYTPTRSSGTRVNSPSDSESNSSLR